MISSILPEIVFGLFPVLLFLAGLVYLDSYKLLTLRAVLVTIAVGSASAMVAALANTWLVSALGVEMATYSRYVAPFLEELIKSAYLVYLLRSHKTGFMVDAAIRGFALGTGFALLENMYYLVSYHDSSLFLWVIRGLGTAVMHGATTAMVGITAKSISDRYGMNAVVTALPGVGGAIALHMVYNNVFLSPSLSTLIIIVVLPTILIAVFNKSEKSTQDWLGVGFDTDRELLEMITMGTLSDTKVGQYLHSLQDRFPGPVVADMLCLLRLRLELSIKAKAILMMQEAGFHVPPDPEVKDKLEECRYLEKSIGRTGKLALLPFLHAGSRDAWQLQMLKAASA